MRWRTTLISTYAYGSDLFTFAINLNSNEIIRFEIAS